VDVASGDEVVSRYRLPEACRLILHETRRGSAAASRNTGIRAAKGDYIALLDQDDVWLPEKLSRQVAAMEAHPDAGACWTHHVNVGADLQRGSRQPKPISGKKDYLARFLDRNIIRTPSAVMMRRATLDACGLFDESIVGAADRDMWIRISGRFPMLAMPEALTLYRMHPGQLHRSERLTRPGRIRQMELAIAWCRRERPEMTPIAERRFARALRKVARLQMRVEKDPAAAMETLRRSAETRPHPALYPLRLEAWWRMRRKHP